MDDETKDGVADDSTTQKTESAPGIDPAAFAAMQESIAKLEAKNRELLEEKARTKKEAEQAALEAAKKSGDLESLEKSWQKKVETTEQELRTEIKQYEQMLASITSGAEARRLAADLALPGHADLLMPHIAGRLKTEIRDGKPTVRVLDRDGTPSAMTVDDLRKEIMGTELFAPILAGSKANGAGGTGRSDGGKPKLKAFNEYTSSELVELKRADPDTYIRIRDEYYNRNN